MKLRLPKGLKPGTEEYTAALIKASNEQEAKKTFGGNPRVDPATASNAGGAKERFRARAAANLKKLGI